MRSIQKRFENFKEKNKNLGDYIVLMRAVKGQGFSKRIINHWFNELVPKSDYESSDKKYLIDELVKVSEAPLRKVSFGV